MDAKSTGVFIALLRKEKGYSQKELAEKLAVTDKAVSRWETGKGFPDVSLLKPLSRELGVSVGELLSGERICQEESAERTDRIILDSLSYARRRLWDMLNLILLILAAALLLSPLYLAREFPPYAVIGAVLLAVGLAWLILRKTKSRDAHSQKVLRVFSLAFMAAALVLELLPYGVVLQFYDGPGRVFPRTFSYFSMTPFGYANFSPLITGLLTVSVFVLLLLGIIRKTPSSRLGNSAFMCSAILLLLSLVPLLLFGSSFMNAVSYMVSGAILLSACFQAAVNRKLS